MLNEPKEYFNDDEDESGGIMMGQTAQLGGRNKTPIVRFAAKPDKTNATASNAAFGCAFGLLLEFKLQLVHTRYSFTPMGRIFDIQSKPKLELQQSN
jgi:hypothetical protein